MREPELQAWWKEQQVYEQLAATNTGEPFTLHDGPPYANGDLHIGHALNKILKDFINKYQSLRGRKVQFVPGWDTHGLPIELKVLQSMKSKERQALTPIALRKRAAAFAVETMRKQRESFKRYGVWAEWDSPYLTLSPQYEAEQIKVFGAMVEQGHIYRGLKPVHWSPSSRTALAEAELEYPENHVSKSIYLGFPVHTASAALQKAAAAAAIQANEVRVAIWTTTPWTIPANLAVAVNPSMEYCLVVPTPTPHTAEGPTAEGQVGHIVAKDLVASLAGFMGLEAEDGAGAGAGGSDGNCGLKIVGTFSGAELVGSTYKHPLCDRVSEVIAGGDYITTHSGTGLVHTAPGHGAEDYLLGRKHGLPLLSPVNDLGRFTTEAGERFAGLDVLKEGNSEVIAALRESGTLIATEDYKHKYPYDWRTKKPTIFRATEQWFSSVSTYRDKALDAIEQVKWIPSAGKKRISSMVAGRGDWCISRQRSWGVPIPVFYSLETGEPLLTTETLIHIEGLVREHGSDCWWEMNEESLLPPSMKHLAEQYSKGTDTMDVWFDSGTSWAGVLKANTGDRAMRYPADLYLEGSDQHRGWFQSSLLTSIASQGVAPYKQVLTHGFVLDEKGFKMSKSVGNVVDPMKIITGGGNKKVEPAYGADTLRLWISSVDYTGDVRIGDEVIKQTSDNYRKMRNTLRYLLGSLSDFDPAVHAVPREELASIDKYILHLLEQTAGEMETAYDSFQFYKANHALLAFASQDLSSFYLDMAKDRLYVSAKDDPRRRSCQTVLHYLLEDLAVLMAPIVPHMAEDVWQNLPYPSSTPSVFQRAWPAPASASASAGADKDIVKKWETVRSVRSDVNKCMEVLRGAKKIGASQECQAVLYTDDPALAEMLKSLQGDDTFLPTPVQTDGCDDLRFVFMASQVTVVSSEEEVIERCGEQHDGCYLLAGSGTGTDSGISVGVARAAGRKCDRCWYYSESVGQDAEHTDVCLRCASVIRADNHSVQCE